MADFSGSEGYKINIPAGKVVSWSIVSQSAGEQTLQIIDPDGETVAQTSVLSRDLSNISTGSFTAHDGGEYTVRMPSDHTVKVDEAVINSTVNVVTKTYLFAGEDGTDNDYNDAFVTVTWFTQAG